MATFAPIQSDITKPTRASTQKRKPTSPGWPSTREQKPASSFLPDGPHIEEKYPRLGLHSTHPAGDQDSLIKDLEERVRGRNEQIKKLESFKILSEANSHCLIEKNEGLATQNKHLRSRLKELEETSRLKDEKIMVPDAKNKKLEEEMASMGDVHVHTERADQESIFKQQMMAPETEKENLGTIEERPTCTFTSFQQAHDDELRQITATVKAQCKELKQLRHQLSTKSNDFSQLQEQSQASITALREKADKLKDRLARKKVDVSNLQGQVDAANRVHLDDTEQLKKQLITQTEHSSTLRAEIDAAVENSRAEVDKLRKQLASQNQDLSAVRAQKDRSLEACRVLSTEIEEVRKAHFLKVEDLEKRTAEAESEVARLKPFEAKAHDLQQELERTELSRHDLGKKVSSLVQQLSEAQSAHETLIGHLEKRTAEAESAVARLKPFETKAQFLEQQLLEARSAQENMSALMGTHNRLRDKHELLKTTNTKSLNKLQKTEAAYSTLQDEVVRLKAEVAQNLAASEKAEQEKHQQIFKLAKELGESQNAAIDATRQQQSTAADFEKLASKLREVDTGTRSTIAALKAMVNEKTTDLRETTASLETALSLLDKATEALGGPGA